MCLEMLNLPVKFHTGHESTYLDPEGTPHESLDGKQRKFVYRRYFSATSGNNI
jgi:hypothetical protein